MNKELKISIGALIIQLLELVISIWSVANTFSASTIICLCFAILSTVALFIIAFKYYKVLAYIKFIEYLTHNQDHNFISLPKIRMYLHSEKIANKIRINRLIITYDIKYNDSDKSKCLGDMIITYDMEIENKNIPDTFNFIYGNDYSNSPQIVTYRYGSSRDYLNMQEHRESIAPYWRGSLKHYDFGIERQLLSQSGDQRISIQVKCKKAFEFMTIPRDTIVCLPDVFSKDIQKMEYHINLVGFEGEFYCDAYRITGKGLKYRRDNIGCEKSENSLSFSKELFPNDIKGEKAFYFRVGKNPIDMEVTN